MQQTALPHDRATLRATAGGSLAEGIVGAGAVAVAIIGLVGVYPQLLLAIATIGIGAALLMQGGAISARMKELIRESYGERATAAEVGGGASAEVMGGVAGIVLGILALIGILPMTLIAIAALVYGGTLVLSSGAMARINNLVIEAGEESNTAKRIAREAVNASAGVQLMIGLGSITLGILALIGISPLILLLVAMLGLGASDLLSGTALGSRMMGALEH